MAAVSVVPGFPGLWPDEPCVKQMGRKVTGVYSVVECPLHSGINQISR